MICAPTDEEAKLLDRALNYVALYVDEIQITITGKNKKCEEVCNNFRANVSHFKWCNDYAKARNYNFKQAKSDYIFWIDCDDVVRNCDKLRSVVDKMDENKIDVAVMDYLYDFDKKSKECTVRHKKTRIVKNGCAEWVGKLHEDFKEKRQLLSYFCKSIEILHLTDKKRYKNSAKRNLEIAKESYHENPKDPRSHWLMANAYMGVGKQDLAMKHFKTFLKLSMSEEEKYLAYLNMALIVENADVKQSIKYTLHALFLRPTYPNAYFRLAKYAYLLKMYDQAINFTEMGLQLPVPEDTIIVWNPREYDLVPLTLLANIYFEVGKYEKALYTVKEIKRLFPNNKFSSDEKGIMKVIEKMSKIEKHAKKLEKMTKKKDIKKYLDTLDEYVLKHPKISVVKNTHFYKKKSSGKDLVYFCYPTKKSWNPKSQNVGGSEEAVMKLAHKLYNFGWNVTVYNHCGKPGNYDGVEYKNYWEYNRRDKQDVTILWRQPMMADYEINSNKVFVDLHDVLSQGEFTEERLAKIDGVFTKSKAQCDLYDNVPNNKKYVVSNGIDFKFFNRRLNGFYDKNYYRILNTSSPDRHLESTLNVFERLIEKEPDKPWKLAWFYGWDLYEEWHKQDKDLMEYMKINKERFDKLVEAGRATGGYFLSQDKINEEYIKAGIFLYPTQFFEINCISAIKAQAANCLTITSDFAALEEINKYGTRIVTKGNKWKTDKTFGDTNEDFYVNAILENIEKPVNIYKNMQEFDWSNIARQWNKIIS